MSSNPSQATRALSRPALTRQAETRLRALPPIHRARGFRLYARDGRRFLDLWQSGGRGVLGMRPKGAMNEMKNALEAGLALPLPSVDEGRSRSGLRTILPGFDSRLFPSTDALSRALDAARADTDMSELVISERRPFAADGLFGNVTSSDENAKTAIPRTGLRWLALPLSGIPEAVLLFAPEGSLAAFGPALDQPLVPALLWRASIRALADLRREETEGLADRETGWRKFSAATKGLFSRDGILLRAHGRARESEESYDRFFNECLSRGVLISPERDEPSFVPAEFSDGEVAKLKELAP